MPSLSDLRVQNILTGLAEAVELEDLTARVLPPLSELLDASAVVIHREHPGGAIEGGPEPFYSEVMATYRAYEHSCPVWRVKRSLRGGAAVTTELVDARDMRRSPVASDIFGPYAAEQQLAARLDALHGSQTSTYLICARSRRQRRWDSAQVELVDSLVPSVSAAVARHDPGLPLGLRPTRARVWSSARGARFSG